MRLTRGQTYKGRRSMPLPTLVATFAPATPTSIEYDDGTLRPAALATRGQLCKCIVVGGHY